MAKTVSPDKTYIDFFRGGSEGGKSLLVRVWPDRCSVLSRTEDGALLERASCMLPVSLMLYNLPSNSESAPINSLLLAVALNSIEPEPELRSLLSGELSFDEVSA
jgi:hypothetical protein